MKVDHIFIFTNDKGKIADELVQLGFTEGSSRVHAGQGTSNRKFYFKNFFLEILWVHDEAEIRNEQVEATGLWKRADFQKNNYSPFGLCLINTQESDVVFEEALKYQPNYFPQGKSIAIVKHEDFPSLPWTFRLPFKGEIKNETEPKKHSNGISKLTKVTFEHEVKEYGNFLSHFKSVQQINFVQSKRTWLTLQFDEHLVNKSISIKALQLTIEY